MVETVLSLAKLISFSGTDMQAQYVSFFGVLPGSVWNSPSNNECVQALIGDSK